MTELDLQEELNSHNWNDVFESAKVEIAKAINKLHEERHLNLKELNDIVISNFGKLC